MSSLPEGWAEYYSPRAQAPYYVLRATGATSWERPADPSAKRARVEDDSRSNNTSGSADAAALERALQGAREQHATEVAKLKGKIVELSATGSVAAGHHAQHGHVAFTSKEEPLPSQPTIIPQHDPSREKELKWTRSDLLVNEVGGALKVVVGLVVRVAGAWGRASRRGANSPPPPITDLLFRPRPDPGRNIPHGNVHRSRRERCQVRRRRQVSPFILIVSPCLWRLYYYAQARFCCCCFRIL
jgi:hypothetical protein